MILKRSTNINLVELKEHFQDPFPHASPINSIEVISQWMELQQVYNAAINEVSTKLEILDEEFQIHYAHNPIHHIECRLKSTQSIAGKVKRLGLPREFPTIKENILDIAGIRVICNYLDDIYTVENLLLGQNDIQLIKRKDYIKSPKNSGYRSLHIIVSVPVFLSKKTEIVPVEIQLRTIAMDYWASLEHKLQYKTQSTDTEIYRQQLIDCADQLAEIEDTMKNIHLHIESEDEDA